MERESAVLRARLMVLAAAALWSLGGVGIKLCGFDAWRIAGIRSAVAALAVLAVLPASRRNWSWKAAGVGLAMALTMVLFVWGNKTTTAANAIFLQGSYPLWILLLSPVALKERITRRDVVLTLVFGVGLACFVFGPERTTLLSPKIARGNALALLSGFGFAATIMGLRSLRGKGVEAATVCGNALAAAMCLPFMAGALFHGPSNAGRAVDWLTVAFLGTFQVALPYLLSAWGLKTLRAMEAALLQLIEPVLNPVWVFLVFQQERPGPWALAGGAIILAAAAFQALAGNHENRGRRV